MAAQTLENFFTSSGWEVAHERERPAREGGHASVHDLSLSVPSMAALEPLGHRLYGHQHAAVSTYLGGENVAVTTSTASGKTLIFNICALEELTRDPKACIAAIYPLKALASEQADRWRKIVKQAGLNIRVGRIDGGVPMRERQAILAESRIVVLTPDIIHAWMLSTVSNRTTQAFLRNLRLVIADEVHVYSGVFGSNAAFLFRRLLHACRKLGGQPRFVASSATMDDAQAHLERLTGETFSVIGQDQDTSPRSTLRTILVNPPKGKDLLTAIAELVAYGATKTDHQSITFVDSRKQTEYLATIIERQSVGPDSAEEQDGAEGEQRLDYARLEKLQVLPYRSGYEEVDRERIQSRLSSGALKGVVSTSALEMGVDLPLLTLGILVGIPRSGTSYYQRVGRVGRKTAGVVVVVNNGSVVSESVFRDPSRLDNLPLFSSALYLHNQRIQYIHAMCLARPSGEDEIVSQVAGLPSEGFSSPLPLPDDFAELCKAERIGEVSPDLQAMKAQAGEDPHHVFPLRDLDVQFKVECRVGPNVQQLGSLSFTQLMRETYPGAVYYYQTFGYRVTKVHKQNRMVSVRKEKRYFTTPTNLPTQIFPNMVGDNIYQAWRYGQLSVVECALQIRDAVIGFKERRGNNELDVQYPLDAATAGCYQDAPKFPYYAFTSGVVLTHPGLTRAGVKHADIARVVDEAFLMHMPFDRQDVSAGSDKHRTARDGIALDARFVCVYDQTYGSLRLTSRLADTQVLREVFDKAVDIARNDPNLQLTAETLAVLEEMQACAQLEPELATAGIPTVPTVTGAGPMVTSLQVLMPGSMGIDTHQDNEEFEVTGVFFSPVIGAVAYRGNYLATKKKAQASHQTHSATTVIVRADRIRPIEGETKIGCFNLETGELSEAASEA